MSTNEQIEELVKLADEYAYWAGRTYRSPNKDRKEARANLEAHARKMVEGEPKWIDDPHDIEQGLMRNPKWKPAPSPQAANIPEKLVCRSPQAGQREVMQMALDCLDKFYPGSWANDVMKCQWEGTRSDTIAALRTALAAKEQS
jgi:hypothetical protein